MLYKLYSQDLQCAGGSDSLQEQAMSEQMNNSDVSVAVSKVLIM